MLLILVRILSVLLVLLVLLVPSSLVLGGVCVRFQLLLSRLYP